MVKEIHKISNNIFVIDNFYEEYNKLIDIIYSHQDSFSYHEGDMALNYSWIDKGDESNNFSSERIIIDKYCRAVRECGETLFNTHVKSKSCLNAIIYSNGSRKGPHTDEFSIDKNGQEYKAHIFSSAHFLRSCTSGGQLYYPDLEISIEPLENRIVFFNSEYLHEVLEVNSGTRISINYFWEKVDNE
jgi:Rps23 Pro-64 3,4-dihydroxylase Tpa1-like proline 4-hydroxylase